MSQPHGAPPLGRVGFDDLRQASRKARADMRAAPLFGLIFSSVYVLIGVAMLVVTRATGQTYWLVFAAVGFPLFGPFAAIGYYEMSRRREQGEPLVLSEIMTVIAHQRRRQLPSICAVIVIIFMFWFFLAHMIFALFMGYSTMTNVSTSYEIYLTGAGIRMLLIGSLVGAGIATVIYMLTVLSLPLLLDREIDFITAMITSVQFVLANPLVMLCWAGLIAVASFAAMLPMFLGLFLSLPFFGHATWHLYRQAVLAGSEMQDTD